MKTAALYNTNICDDPVSVRGFGRMPITDVRFRGVSLLNITGTVHGLP